jgi:hypothetical protein
MAGLVRRIVNLAAERGVTRLENGHGYTQTGQDSKGQEQYRKPTAGLDTMAKATVQATYVQGSNAEARSINHR